ncbi:MAG: nitroreductase family protein [Erysipelotrichaceae bacterium]|nr:nitroreductase family protein [Erysipelotrichaceae bacterium]
MEFKEVIQNRYSCKNFDGRKIEKEKLQAILEAGRIAPFKNSVFMSSKQKRDYLKLIS